MAKEKFVVVDNTERIPVLGKLVFRITEGRLKDRQEIFGSFSPTVALTYYAVDAIQVKSLEYADDTLKKIIINKGMRQEGDDSKSLEIRYDIEKNFNDTNNASTIFIDEEKANALAAKLNRMCKEDCQKIIEALARANSEYDKLIAICEGK